MAGKKNSKAVKPKPKVKVKQPLKTLSKSAGYKISDADFWNVMTECAGIIPVAVETFIASGRKITSQAVRERALRQKEKWEKIKEAAIEKCEDTIMYFATQPSKGKLALDAAKFAAERLNKNKWAARTEHTGPNGGAIEMLPSITIGGPPKKDEQ
jgi:hypothetical protein